MQFCAYLRKKLTRAKASARNHRSQPLALFLHLPQINLVSSVIAALRTFETGQFFSASLAIGIPNPDALGGPNHEFDPVALSVHFRTTRARPRIMSFVPSWRYSHQPTLL
jgi:hypothetical protein